MIKLTELVVTDRPTAPLNEILGINIERSAAISTKLNQAVTQLKVEGTPLSLLSILDMYEHLEGTIEDNKELLAISYTISDYIFKEKTYSLMPKVTARLLRHLDQVEGKTGLKLESVSSTSELREGSSGC